MDREWNRGFSHADVVVLWSLQQRTRMRHPCCGLTFPPFTQAALFSM
jgi:hypothetical protein